MSNYFLISNDGDAVIKNRATGQNTTNPYRKEQNTKASIWDKSNIKASEDDKTKNVSTNEVTDDSDETNNTQTDEVTDNSDDNSGKDGRKLFTQMSNSANNAYTHFLKKGNSGISSGSMRNTIMNSGRLTYAMETIDDRQKQNLEFLDKSVPEGGNISGSVNCYYEKESNSSQTTLFGEVKNCWQNKKKNIYTEFYAATGYNNETSAEGERTKKVVGNVSFNARLDKGNFKYGAGANYYSETGLETLDFNISTRHKQTGIGADLTRRTTITRDEETGGKNVKNEMKLKIDIISNKNDNPKNDDSSNRQIKFESGTSALPSEVEEVNTKAQNMSSSYIKPERKNGFDVDFEYNNNQCGATFEYNRNFYNKNNEVLSIAPVIGLHEYTDPTLDNNNESFEMTTGVITQFGKKYSNGQTFTGTITAMADRMVKKGSRPYDTTYILANACYNNPKAKFSAAVDAGMIKSGNITLNYANLIAEKQFKNSALELSAGISKYSYSGGENEKLFNVLATYKYNIPYKTKK